jgi:SAM-dependent methyltransferase
VTENEGGALFATRGFYGALRIADVAPNDPEEHQFQLVHGQTLHGLQFQAPERRRWHTTYYSTGSGIGVALEQHPTRTAGRPLRVGLIGLGTGTLASYLDRGDYGRFYEINPQVLEVATERFSYLPDAQARGADAQVLLGDARIVLERQLAAGEPQRFDVLAVDAFTSDAIPIHLLTDEAMAIYQRHVAPGGVIAIHISNRYLDLAPVVRALAEARGLGAYFIENPNIPERGVNLAQWVLVTDNEAFLRSEVVRTMIRPWPEDAPAPVLWTDDYSALLPLLRF